MPPAPQHQQRAQQQRGLEYKASLGQLILAYIYCRTYYYFCVRYRDLPVITLAAALAYCTVVLYLYLQYNGRVSSACIQEYSTVY